MRIVINALSARYGGGTTYLRNLLGYHEARDGVQLIVLAEPSLALPVRPDVQRVDVGRVAGNPFSRSLWERLRLQSLLRELEADVYFCPGGVLTVSPPAGVRSVVMFRNMLPFDHRERARYGLGYMKVRNALLERELTRSMIRADAVIFVSDYARTLIEQRIGGRIATSVTIPHGIADVFRSAAADAGPRPAWVPDDPYLLYVSFFEIYKNQLEVVRAYALLREMRPTPEKLVLAGHHASPYGGRVKREIRRLGLDDHVILTGTVAYENLPELYRHARMNLFASSCENCPNIMLEAMAAGRPLLASRRPPMPEFGAAAAVLFDPHLPREMAEVMASVIDDDRRMNELSRLALVAAARYDWKTTAHRTMEVLTAGR